MTKYFLDTGILLGYIRGSGYAEYVEHQFKLMEASSIPLISIVTVGEIYSLAEQFHWGEKKKRSLENLLNEIHAVDINHPQILRRYAELDAFSQGKHKNKKLPEGMTARNMGKNDLWIAASVSAINAELITTDKDFEHLKDTFLRIHYIAPSTTHTGT